MDRKNDLKDKSPVINVPSPEGQCYESVVPDTLELSVCAELALNGLGGTINPDLYYEPYAFTVYYHKTPSMRHDGCGLSCAPKYAESFPMMRIMCGSSLYADREAGLMRELVGAISPDDGLYYSLYRNRPWHTSYDWSCDGCATVEDFASVLSNGRMIRAMVAWRERDGDKVWEKRICDMARGLAKIAVDKGDYAYYPDSGLNDGFCYPRSGWKHTNEPQKDDEGIEGSVVCYHGHQIYGLAQWYQISGDKSALELARKISRFVMKPKFWDAKFDPVSIAGDELAHFPVHVHAKLLVLRGLLEYAKVAGDFRVMEFVRSGYEFARTLGIPRLGWLRLDPNSPISESCVQADLVALGIRLSDMGLGDYWDDVDAVVRNALVEQQFSRADLMEKVSAASGSPPETSESDKKRYENPGQVCTENVISRTIGNILFSPRSSQCQ